MSKLITALGIGTIGVVGVIVLIAALFAISTAFTAFFVALIWNWIGLHSLFSLGALTFWQVVGVAAAINLIRSVIRPTTITTTTEK